MLTRFRIGRLGAIALLLTGLVSCGKPSGSNLMIPMSLPLVGEIIKVSDIQQTNRRDTTVYLKGKTGNQVPFLGKRAYELQDATGTIWIVTSQAPPKSGDEVTIKGVVRYQSIRLDGKEQGSFYIEQLEQIDRLPASQIKKS